jgi:hypothetical protein
MVRFRAVFSHPLLSERQMAKVYLCADPTLDSSQAFAII